MFWVQLPWLSMISRDPFLLEDFIQNAGGMRRNMAF